MEEDKERYDELCRTLNMDEATQTAAWTEFERILDNFTIEGDKLHWLACSLYVSCRTSVVETVGGEKSSGNSVSLTQILRNAGLSLIQFFHKINNWMDMVNTDPTLRERIEALERKFEVASCVFQKYDKIFRDIFQNPGNEVARAMTRGRKSKTRVCSLADLYKFCWTLYVYVKGHYPLVNGDLVNSHHLLLCCMDMFYSAALVNNRRNLLNPEFQALPKVFKEGGVYELEDNNPPCIMEFLCEQYNGIVREAKAVREHYWRPYLEGLYTNKILRGSDDSHMMDLFEMPHYVHNSKAVSQEYEQFVLSKGEFDEHIFLGENSQQEIGTPSKTSIAQNTPFEARSKVSRNLARHFEKVSTLSPPTPLTGRNYLAEKIPHITPVSTATQCVRRLQSLVAGCQRKPSESLGKLLQSFDDGLASAIETRLEELKTSFVQGYCDATGDNASQGLADFAQTRVCIANVLYYKLLETILNAEKKRLQDNFSSSISALLAKNDFHTSLFGCCLEIVLFSYNSQYCFPWILEILKIPAYHFYKVIEVIIKEEQGLSRSMVKHLNQVEEQILDCLAWQSGSPLYATLPPLAPAYEEVSLKAKPTPTFSGVTFTVPALGPSAQDRFSSPLPIRHPPIPVTLTTSSLIEKPKQSRSLVLFYRKVYHLAHVRLANLCEKLELDDNFHQKIWTCLEHSLVHFPRLMQDRHLDQLMMCAVYIVAKVLGFDFTFQKIMEHYRHQPQARSHIYRSVLLKAKGQSSSQKGSQASDSPSRGTRRSARRMKLAVGGDPSPSHPSDDGGSASSPAPIQPEPEERSDIIGFYNKVYIHCMKNFALRFSPSESSDCLPTLSPLPVFKKNQMSPKRKVSAHHSLYLSPQNSRQTRDNFLTPRSKMLYCFSRSPAKKLKEMNEAVAARGVAGRPTKRLITFDESNPVAKRSLAESPFADSLRSLSQEREDASSRDSMLTE
eukprot:m.1847 g.1847  ORF g.1847 m.1847 type:complete len:955 (+) comp7962_c0_seq1:163-3027(+)